MQNKNTNSLVSWMLTRPALFAVIAFAAMTIGSMVGGLITGGQSVTITTAITIITFLGAAAWLVRTLPGANLTRRNFVAINNAQTLVTSVIVIASMLYIMANAQTLMARLLWMETNSSARFLGLLIGLALFYLYLSGIYIANMYAKYRRIRAMGVSMWKTLATAPFGFSMLWIPGYLMDDPKTTSAKKDAPRGWYWRLTDWIIAHGTRTAAALVILLVLTGLTFGYFAMLVPMTMAIIFAAWSAIIGTDKMRKNLGGIYSTVAIIINVIMIVVVVGYATIMRPNNNMRETVPEIIQTTNTAPAQ